MANKVLFLYTAERRKYALSMIEFFKETSIISGSGNISSLQSTSNTHYFRNLCSEFIIDKFHYPLFQLNKSCTQALELAFKILSLPKDSEVILPSYAFVSVGNAIVQSGLTCVFVDCDKETMNIDANCIESAITEKTKAIVTINYGGVACNYDKIKALCQQYQLFLVEDNAHGYHAKYQNQWLGNFGDISTISFDFMKNISCNEGGGICINNQNLKNPFKLAFEFGTNRSDFNEGKTSFYEWKSLGSNHLLAEPLAKILYQQLIFSESIIQEFKRKWNRYYQLLDVLDANEKISLAKIPQSCEHNGHMFWLKSKDQTERCQLMDFLKKQGIQTAFHYTPLHSSEFGRRVGVFKGEDKNTTSESQKLLRLPLYYSLKDSELEYIVSKIYEFYSFQYIR